VENMTVFWPLLDSLADLNLNPETTEEEFYERVLRILKEEFLSDPVTLGSFELGLSLHTAAPKIEAYYQYYRSSVVPSVGESYDEGCDAWVHFDGQQICQVEDLQSALAKSPIQRYTGNMKLIDVIGKSRYCRSIMSTTPLLLPQLQFCMRTSRQMHLNRSTQP